MKNQAKTLSRKRTLMEIRRHSSVYLLMLLPVLYYIIFRYGPIWHGQIAFRDFSPYDGLLGSEWVGLKFFRQFINSFYFWSLIRNTLMYSFGKLLISVPAAIIFAVAVYECVRPKLARAVQTIAYLPHFYTVILLLGTSPQYAFL